MAKQQQNMERRTVSKRDRGLMALTRIILFDDQRATLQRQLAEVEASIQEAMKELDQATKPAAKRSSKKTTRRQPRK